MSDAQVNLKALDALKATLSVVELVRVKRYGREIVTLFVLSLSLDGLTRRETMDITSIKWTTQHDVLVRLEVHGLVTREEVKHGRGRPLVIWRIKDELKEKFARLTGRQLLELVLNAPDMKEEFTGYLLGFLRRVRN